MQGNTNDKIRRLNIITK